MTPRVLQRELRRALDDREAVCIPTPAVPVLWAVAGGSTAEPPFGRRVDVGP